MPGQVVDDGRDVRGPEHHRDHGRIVLALGVNGCQCLDKLGVPVLLLPPEELAEPSAGEPLPSVVVIVRLIQAGQAERLP